MKRNAQKDPQGAPRNWTLSHASKRGSMVAGGHVSDDENDSAVSRVQ